MARKEARIYVEVWEHERFKGLSVGAQWLYWAILSQADLSFCGVLSPASPWWATLATDASQTKIERWLAELHTADFVVHDVPASQVWIAGFIRRDGVLKRSNLIVAMSRAYAEVRSITIRRRIMAEMQAEFPDGALDAMRKDFDKGNDKSITERMHHRMVNDIAKAFQEGIPNAIPDASANGKVEASA